MQNQQVVSAGDGDAGFLQPGFEIFFGALLIHSSVVGFIHHLPPLDDFAHEAVA